MTDSWRPRYNPWLIALTVTLATFMEVLDTSIANVALPHIAGNLSAGVDEATWTITSYLVSNAIIIPMTGWLARVFGRKRYLIFKPPLAGLSDRGAYCSAAYDSDLQTFIHCLSMLGYSR